MNNTYIYVADNNNTDMFDIQIPSFDTGSELPLPVVSSRQTSEFESFANKSLISFGTMLICIVIFLVIVLIIKKRKSKADYQTNNYQTDYLGVNDKSAKTKSMAEGEMADDTPIPEPAVIPQTKKSLNLNTPGSIHKCILSFLENTKEK